MKNRNRRAPFKRPATTTTTMLLVILLALSQLALSQSSGKPGSSGQSGSPSKPAAPGNSGSPVKPGEAASSASPLPVVREVDLAALRKLLRRDAAGAASGAGGGAAGNGETRPLLVNFWATWCEPCREEFPDLVRIDEQYGASKLDFITISLDDVADIQKGVPQYLQRLGAHMPAYLLNVPDPEAVINLVDPQWTGAMPATFLFDAHGALVFKHTGRIRPDELRAAIDKTLASAR